MPLHVILKKLKKKFQINNYSLLNFLVHDQIKPVTAKQLRVLFFDIFFVQKDGYFSVQSK